MGDCVSTVNVSTVDGERLDRQHPMPVDREVVARQAAQGRVSSLV